MLRLPVLRDSPVLSPRWRKAAGDLSMHRGRTLLSVIAIAAGLAAGGTVLNSWALVRVATREGYLASDPAAATLRVDSAPAAMLALVRTVPGVRDAESRRTTTARMSVNGTTLTALLFTSDDQSARRIGRLRSESGDWPPADGAMTVERSSMDFSGAAVGESVRLSVNDGAAIDLRVSGIARDVGLAPGWMEHVVYGFVPWETLRALGVPDQPNEIRLVVQDGSLDQTGVRRIALAARDALQAAGLRVTNVDVPVPGEHIHAAQMDSLLFTQGAFAIMALLLSAFLVVNLIAAMLAGQVREIGVMKSIGARSGQIAALYLTVSAVLGVAAVAIAVPIALFAGARYATIKADLLNFDLTGYATPLWAIVLQVGVGVLLPVAAALFPVRRGCRMSVAEALRDVGIRDDASPPRALLMLGGVSRPALLSIRNAFRRRQRMVLTLLALSSAGAVFIGALNLRRAVRGATDIAFASLAYDFSLRVGARAHPDSLTAVVRGVEGVAGAEAWSGATATIDREDGTLGNGFTVVALPDSSTLFSARLTSGRWLRAGDERALVAATGLVRQEPGLTVGSRVRLIVAGTAAEWTVVGTVAGGPAPTAYTSRAALAEFAGVGAATVVVRSTLAGEASQLDLIQRIRAALLEHGMPVASSMRLAESRRSTEDHLLMVVDFLGAMAWLMLVVGGLGLGSTMAIAVLERTREIGVLRAIGARDGAILLLVQSEGLTIGLLSWVIALPLSVPMSLLLGEAFGRIMLPVEARPLPDATAVGIWFALVLVVSLLASAWPAWRAMRVPAARALAYE